MTEQPAIKVLEQLPEPFKSEAISEAKRQHIYSMEYEAHSLSSAIATAFLWYNTPQGAAYWRDVARKFWNN